MQKAKTQQKENLNIIFIISGTAISVYLIFKFILPFVWPFILAYFIVVGIMPIVLFLNKRLRMPKALGGGLTLALILIFLGIVLRFVGMRLIEQFKMLIKNIPVYQNMFINHMQNICRGCDNMFGLKAGYLQEIIEDGMNQMLGTLQGNLMPAVTQRTINIVLTMLGVATIVIIIIISVILILQDMDSMKSIYQEFLFYEELRTITDKLSNAGIAYLRSQSILMFITAVICTMGLFLIKNDYALLLGMLIAIFDAFPVLGSGFILVPWAIIMLISKDVFAAAVLMSIYLLCQLIRQFLEPRLLGNRIGIKPIFTIMAMYAGLKLFGFIGFILGPVALILIITIIKMLCPDLDKARG